MPEATEVQIRAAIVAELNDVARSWNGQFTAAGSWLPVYDDGILETLQVAVVAQELAEERISRGVQKPEKCDYGVVIDFQKQVDSEDVATLNTLSKLVQDVHDFFRDGHRLATMNSAIVFSAFRPDIYLLPRLYVDRVFETIIDLRVWVLR